MKKIANLGLLGVGILWGLGFVVAKIAFNNGISPTLLLVIRFVLATLVLSLVFIKELIKIKKSDIKKIFLLGLLIFLAYCLQMIGSKYTTASKAAFYTAINIIFVPYVAWLLHRKSPKIKTYISTIIAMIGIFFISYEEGTNLFQLNLGDVLIIISSIFFGAQIAITGAYVKRIKTLKIVLIQSYIATIGFIILELFLLLIGFEILRPITNVEWSALIYLGVLNSGFCVYIQVYCQKYVSEVKTSLLLTTESLFAPFFAYFILHEKIGLNIIIGALFIFLSLIILEINIIRG